MIIQNNGDATSVPRDALERVEKVLVWEAAVETLLKR